MSDRSQATEKATPQRRSQKRKQGEVPVSREVATAAAVSALAIFLIWGAKKIGADVGNAMHTQLLSLANSVRPTPLEEFAGVFQIATPTARMWVFLAAAVVGALAFVGASACFSIERLSLKPNRLDPVAGLKRLFGVDILINIARSTVVALIIVGISMAVLRGLTPHVLSLSLTNPKQIAVQAGLPLMLCTGAVACALALVAVVDVLVVRARFEQRIRMTREEIKQEHKDSEGDPMLRGRRRRKHRDLVQNALATTVPTANMVVANPTHVAVALRYRPGIDPAPVAVAKGIDQAALRIRIIATKHGIPVVENRPLARSLLASVRIGSTIPSEFYRAVAEVMAFLHRQGTQRISGVPR